MIRELDDRQKKKEELEKAIQEMKDQSFKERDIK